MPPPLSSSDRKDFLNRALKAADWFVNSQLGSYRPDWNADRGRFMYYYHIPSKKHVPGINWTTGRALFVVSEAYKLTKKKPYLTAGKLGAAYLGAMQVMDPFFRKACGVFKENTPQGDWCGMLDGAQAASGLLMLYQATGQREYLRRGKAFCDFLLRNFKPNQGGFPIVVYFKPHEEIRRSGPYLDWTERHCTAIPMWHLHQMTGDKKYLQTVVYAADAILSAQRKDGAFNFKSNIRNVPPPKPGHHEGVGSGMDRYAVRNDDGLVTVILAAHAVTKKTKYLDAMVSYAEWIMKSGPLDRPYCSFPIQASNLWDIGAVSGKDFSPWILDNLQKRLLAFQVMGSKDPCAEGGFRGEDEQGEGGIFGGRSLEYVPTRNTCYAAGLLFRLSGKGTGSGFSVFGLERP